MRYLLLTLLFPALLYSQEYTEINLLDMSGVTGDTIKSISLKPVKGQGRMVEVDFTTVNCDLLQLNIGYGVSDEFPMFIDTIPGSSLPVLLDKTANLTVFQGDTNNSKGFDFAPYDGNYLWLQIIDNAACTSGEVKVRFSK